MLEDGLQRLVFGCWRLFDRFAEREFVVRPSIPVLFHGDLNAYLASPIRAITVDLNPASADFPEEDPFRHFPGGEELAAVPASERDAAFVQRYLDTLAGYFHTEPYLPRFSSYEAVLRGMGVTYRGDLSRIALNTGLFSPIATVPAWSKLDLSARREMRGAGVRIWHRLVRSLEPNVVLVSVARQHLGLLGCPFRSSWGQLCEFTHKLTGERRRRPYVVERAVTDAEPPVRIVFGPAAHSPFGMIASDEKRSVGERILEDVFSG